MDKKTERNKKHDMRVQILTEELCKGMNQASIYNKYKDKWSVSRTTICDMCQEAYDLLKIGDEAHMNELRQLNIKRLEDVYMKAMKQKDNSAAIKAIDVMNKATGLYVTKIDLGGSTNFKFSFMEDNTDNQNTDNQNTDNNE